MRTPVSQLRTFVGSVLALNVVAALVAVAINWPTQFGRVGTDAGDDVLTSGTAISAPLLPVVVLLVALLLAGRRGALGWVGIVAAYLAAAIVAVGGFGELVAEPTTDTPRAVLVTAGVAWLLVAAALVVLATRAATSARATAA